MYYEKMMQWSTHLELKLEHLYEIIKQFIKITEYAREGKLHPSTIFKAQLQEVITEIHTKMEDCEFPIPNSHIRVELLLQIGKTDLKIKSGKLLISVDIPLLDRKALQLYKIYSFSMYQNISGNYTRAIYILPRKQYIALTEDERKFFLADKEYYNTCQKTIYHTICENTQPIHETVTTTSCECQMLIRPLMEILIGTQINVNSEVFIYNPGFSLNISEISPIIYKTMHIPSIKSFFWETKKDEKLKNLHTEESPSSIEEQLLDMENSHYRHKLTQKYWLGGSSILTLLIITTVMYLTQGIIRKNCKTCNNKNLNIKEIQEEVELQPLSVDNQTNT